MGYVISFHQLRVLTRGWRVSAAVTLIAFLTAFNPSLHGQSGNSSQSASTPKAANTSSPAIFVTVFPQNVSLFVGRPQQFTSHVFLSTNSAVTWAVNGVNGGNATSGTIDFTGLYTPPSQVPAKPGIIITATSQADPTKLATVSARVVAQVTVTPPSDSLHVGESAQLSATVLGVTNTLVTWAVSGVTGGNTTVGLISPTGLYIAPVAVPRPGMLTVTATSVADPTEPGVAGLKIYGAKMLTLYPASVDVLEGGKINFQYHTNVYYRSTQNSYKPIVRWIVNGVAGGNSTVGTITAFGQYLAPLAQQTVTVTAESAVDPAYTATATVRVGQVAGQKAAASLIDTMTKVRPYDVITGATTINLAAAAQEYADWQVLVTGVSEDLTGVDVAVSDFRDSRGNTISQSNATIYLEKYLNIANPSRLHGSDTGEWPEPLIPKVDPFVHETRNAFPFNVNRISPAYRKIPITTGGASINSGIGDGTASSSGVYTGTAQERFDIIVDGPGAVGAATFKWSTDGGVTFRGLRVPTSINPISLSDGVRVSFRPGGVVGVLDFNTGDTFWIHAGPLRNQPVWIDLYVPQATPSGDYTGNVTVSQAGKPPAILPVNLHVYTFTLPATSSMRSLFEMSWTTLTQAHYLLGFGPQTQVLGELYGTACLINRITCGSPPFGPIYSYNSNGTIASADYRAYDAALSPLANGTATPHGETLTSIKMGSMGTNETKQFFSIQDLLAHLASKGWRTRLLDYSSNEPHYPADFVALMKRASLVRSVDNSLRTLATTGISNFNFTTVGYISRYVASWMALGLKDYQRGPSASLPAFYQKRLAQGDELWWYDSCVTHGCSGNGGTPFMDNYPALIADTSAVMNRVWGLMTLVPYGAAGMFYYDTTYAFSQYYRMAQPRIDAWDSIYYYGGNGDGTFFYPGRPANIGGTTHIPIESLRLKHIRDAMVDAEYGLKLIAQGDRAFLETNVLNLASDIFTYDGDPAAWIALRKTLGQKIK
ncbi:MAG: DUF4091 domain-containing protein [Acidipila sp.]|nr:DUF4091 domain-containing protein [Acidipila sp.]